jgi:hypothetical protein
MVLEYIEKESPVKTNIRLLLLSCSMWALGIGMGVVIAIGTLFLMAIVGLGEVIHIVLLPFFVYFFLLMCFFLLISLNLLYCENSWILEKAIVLGKKKWLTSQKGL